MPVDRAVIAVLSCDSTAFTDTVIGKFREDLMLAVDVGKRSNESRDRDRTVMHQRTDLGLKLVNTRPVKALHGAVEGAVIDDVRLKTFLLEHVTRGLQIVFVTPVGDDTEIVVCNRISNEIPEVTAAADDIVSASENDRDTGIDEGITVFCFEIGGIGVKPRKNREDRTADVP